MRSSLKRVLGLAVGAAAMVAATCSPGFAAEKKDFKVAWSIYAGWMPWGYAADSGLMKKWADKYGIKVEIVQINDYVESINQYTAGGFDGCVMTNMDALTIPAAGGVDSTALISGDFSNGNDGIVLKKGKSVADLKGQKINLVELSVSHYLLARALDSVKLKEKDVSVVNTSDADIVSVFTSSKDSTAVVTWNPQLAEVAAVKGATKVFDSSKIPGEIIDLMVVNSATLKDNPALGKALTGVWYEMMAKMEAGDTAMLEAMAKASGTDLAGYKAQLATTKMFYKPADAVTFATSAQLPKTMDMVRTFSFEHGLLGEGAKSKDAVGIAFPGGKTIGDAKNVKLRFDADFMKLAADGKL
ncbi:putative urea ABC transporter substrate-binding protein [Magnetospirillum gryphiswaldense]|uniref:ABC transporter, periplasmic substrate-binding protein n=1 Tax=Magnetospirillum gryphiswaldense TaxID=55518 RepID=A4U4L9_9PROT|nr:putative urea ABC transporter substrate-binding protein [Magnetospirillum gryphiswaldense]AVM72653.1 alkanesulfonate transporter substrate-binding subunit [Magnetospirillum gryphiswaldense MSR-1]AVM76556.1 alkanesulfonate transporter substrate-binding subunit [Magnetospirillum gryphiswaldense]CAM77826.1 ABC transporter, periplasmic substrate-binding protein [Magnetospirillum gryphiswaldense MSR-1]